MNMPEEKYEKHYFRRSIRFRIFRSLFLFTAAVLLFLFISQVVFMPMIYKYIKTQECIQTSAEIKEAWNTDNIKNVILNIRK